MRHAPIQAMRTRLRTATLSLAALTGAIAATYGAILGSYFYGDDFLNLQLIVDTPLGFYLLQPFGGHVLLVRGFVFWLTHLVAGTHAAVYFATVLLVHVLNAALLWGALRRLVAPPVALLATMLWAVAPVHEGSLGWYAAFGHPLSTVPMVGVLLMLARRPGGAPLSPREAGGIAGLLLLASWSFGVGIGFTLVFPAALLALVGWRGVSPRARWIVLAVPIVTIASYLALHAVYDRAYSQDSRSGLAALVSGLRFWWVPPQMLGHLLLVGPAAMVGGLAPSTWGYPSLPVVVVGAGFWVLVCSALVTAEPVMRRWLVAVLVLAVGGYGMIAAGRAVLLGILTALPALGAGEGRYHYAPLLFLAVAFGLALEIHRRGLGVGSARILWGLGGGWAVSAMVVARLGGWHVNQHEDARRMTTAARAELAEAIARASPDVPILLPNRPFPAAAAASGYFAGLAGVYVIFFPEDPAHPVRFVEPDAGRRARVLAGSRLAHVLVAPPGPTSGGQGR